MRLFCLIALSFFLSCSEKKKITTDETYFLTGKPIAELKSKKLEEVSGLVASIANPGYLWTHNDSGNGPDVFLIDTNAKIKLRCTLKGIENRDWEDISIGDGPIPGKKYIYVGDIGDNFAQYAVKIVYRFEEPVLSDSVKKLVITDFETIKFKLEDEKKDTETLMIDPRTNDLYVISKREEPVYVYQLKFPFSTTDTSIAKRLFSIPLTQIVAGDFSSDGNELVLKNYEEIYYWKTPKEKSLQEALKEKPEKLAYVQEAQGEAIAWARDNSGFYTLTEKVEDEKCELLFHKRNEQAVRDAVSK